MSSLHLILVGRPRKVATLFRHVIIVRNLNLQVALQPLLCLQDRYQHLPPSIIKSNWRPIINYGRTIVAMLQTFPKINSCAAVGHDLPLLSGVCDEQRCSQSTGLPLSGMPVKNHPSEFRLQLTDRVSTSVQALRKLTAQVSSEAAGQVRTEWVRNATA